MAATTKEQMKRYLEGWQLATDRIEQERSTWLENMDDDECRRVIARLFSGRRIEVAPRSSGLIEQQAAFHRRK
jgi:hypothetical protein